MVDLVSHGPQLDWSHDQGLCSQLEDWREECELILGGSLKSTYEAGNSNYVRLWDSNTGREYISGLSPNENQILNLAWIPDKLKYYCKPKSNTLPAATEYNRLEQVDLCLPEFIIKTQLLSI